MLPVSDAAARLSSALADRYRLDRELGRGGMATVYLAHDIRHERDVALKVLRPELAAMLGRERFLAEIRTTARLDHPHILTLIDSGESDGVLWYVVPFIRGESLRQRLDRERQLRVDEALSITRNVASALDYANRQGIVHRDVKPENILLHEGEAMLADFGIALALREAAGERLTGTGMSVGTPQYMSPEQAAAEPQLDARSDVYSLGAVLYEMLAGEPPFTGATGQAVIAKLMTSTPPPLVALRSAIPQGVSQAVARALAKVPADRFATAADFAAALASTAGGQPATPSVAILPFKSMGSNPDHEFFADGITEDVIAQLSKIRSLKVIAWSSVMALKGQKQTPQEIGATLQVKTLLEGSVRQAGDRVRIVAQLIDSEQGRHLWAETYDRRLDDVFAIQTDVALQIATALKAELSLDERARIWKEPTRDIRAYQFYLKGRQCYSKFTEEGIQEGIEYFRKAIAVDPGYAMAHAGIAVAWAEIAAGGSGGTYQPDQAVREARDAVTKALALDGSLGEAHAVLATLKFIHDFDWVGAEAGFKLALELSPGAADIYAHYGWLCSALGRHEEALALVARAQELDPLMHRSDFATELIRAGRYEEALQAAMRCIEVDPAYARGRATLGWALIKNGMVKEGLAELERAAAIDPDHSLFLAQLGQAYGMAGQDEKAREVLKRLTELAGRKFVSPYHLAYLHTGLGEYEAALDMLERAFEIHAGSVYALKGSFLFTPLHPHPRFQALLRKLNLA
jgi:serine/threonine protein kinase/tetratricopeptide (TPR) repeat protein